MSKYSAVLKAAKGALPLRLWPFRARFLVHVLGFGGVCDGPASRACAQAACAI
jgi:hypothetical protein